MCKIALAKYLDATVDDAQYIVKDGRRFWPLPYENGFVESEFDMQPDDIVVMCELHSQVHLAGWVSAAELEKYKIS